MNKNAADYYPYGKVLREYNPQTEKYLTTHHERDTETGLDYRGARYYDADVARFLSLDPKAVDYPSLSDYNYVAGNPIVLIDEDGKDVTFHGKTEDIIATVDALQKRSGLNLSIDKNGKLGVSLPSGPIIFAAAKLSEADIALATAINSNEIFVNLITTRELAPKSITVSHPTKTKVSGLEVGGFDGSVKLPNGNIKTFQFFNISQARNEEEGGGNSVGTNAFHEILESFFGGLYSPGTKNPSLTVNPLDDEAYENAHEKAAKVDKSNFKESEESSRKGFIKVNGIEIDLNKLRFD